MMYLTPIPKQFLDESGVPYSGGTVTVYLNGTTDKADIYMDAYGEQLHENPAVLNSNGVWQCFVPEDTLLDYVVKDCKGNVVDAYERVIPADATMSTMLWIFCQQLPDDDEAGWLYQTTFLELAVGLKWLGNEEMMIWPVMGGNVEFDDANETITFNEYVEA